MCFANSVAINLKLIQNLPLSPLLGHPLPFSFSNHLAGFSALLLDLPLEISNYPPTRIFCAEPFNSAHLPCQTWHTLTQHDIQPKGPPGNNTYLLYKAIYWPFRISSSIQRSPSNCFFFP